MCEHRRRRSLCKECGGSCVCEHGRERRKCLDCICEHALVRRDCSHCKLKAIRQKSHGKTTKRQCPHGQQRSTCKDCRSRYYCHHLEQKHRCKECGGSSLCEHGRVRSVCKQCLAAGPRTLAASFPLRNDEARFAPRGQNKRLS